MIVYQADKRTFREDVLSNRIDERIQAAFLRAGLGRIGNREQESWRNSLSFMDRVIEPDTIPSDTSVALEMMLPQSNKRIDFVLTGLSAERRKVAIIVELKQWQSAELTGKDGIVRTFVGGAERETNHPSYQAWSYAAMLEDFNEAVREVPIGLHPCAYLHNCADGTVIQHDFYRDHLKRAPVFLKDDALRLREFIQRHVRYGDRGETLYEIVQGRIRPSKSLADKLSSLLQGNREFVLIDDQKLVYETALDLAKKAQQGRKQTLIVEGGPGTGKSVVAINLLVELIKQQMNVQYVTRNSAPREVYAAKLSGDFKKGRINNLFRGSGSYWSCETDTFDALLVDEAHRLNAKSGMFNHQGENQIKELIQSAKLTVFFTDEAQRVAWLDIGSIEGIKHWASTQGSEVTTLQLQSQFRCGGSDGYLGWVDNTLGIRETANTTLEGVTYDVRVCDSANELRALIREKNLLANKARMVAGYCWPWNSKKDPKKDDIVLPKEQFAAKWNMADDGMLWIMKEHSVEQVGCIHTCQGLELDYVGVIFGPDLVIRKGQWMEFPDKRDRHDKSIKGYYKLALEDHLAAQRRAREIIRNTYRTLMTRGTKGCFIYSVDEETNTYLKQAARRDALPEVTIEPPQEILPFEPVDHSEIQPYINCLPCFPDIKVAAGAFVSSLQSDDCLWVKPKDDVPIKPGYFIAKVTGESMNRRIPNGAWCLFRPAPEGSRQGRILLVQHRDIQDPDSGACTVKRYSSEKRQTDDSWEHSKITLTSESFDLSFKPITLELREDGELRVIGELYGSLM
ncbi:MAG: DUF2075 domain-containing protein [Verrucomicrobia bacterium]|nr:DUF2075 domain-containing protein [Verrucomicrobiota bacterium]